MKYYYVLLNKLFNILLKYLLKNKCLAVYDKDLRDVTFTRCRFSSIIESDFSGAMFVNCSFKNSDFTNSNMSFCNMGQAITRKMVHNFVINNRQKDELSTLVSKQHYLEEALKYIHDLEYLKALMNIKSFLELLKTAERQCIYHKHSSEKMV